MICFPHIFVATVVCIVGKIIAQDDDWIINILGKEYTPMREQIQDLYLMENKVHDQGATVNLRLYYESYCPGCIMLDTTQFKGVVNALSPYLDIETYPYGNAQTINNDGKVEIKCQHGPGECYGNQLHACALKHISNHTEALLFNICMMEPNNKTKGSDDDAAIRCAREMNINEGPILQCAKGEEGFELLKHYGKESEKANFAYVPYVLINGVEWNGDDLLHDVCAAFKNPPEACQQLSVVDTPRWSYCFQIDSQMNI